MSATLELGFQALPEVKRKDWDPYVESLVFIKNKYGQNKGSLYFLRMGAIINFRTHYAEKLREDKLVTIGADGGEWWDDHLAEAFARLPFTIESFRYEDVKRYVASCKKPS